MNDHTEGLDLRQHGSGVIIVAAGVGVAIVALSVTVEHTVSEWRYALVFGLLIAVGEMVQFRVDRMRNRAPIATSAALGYAMLRQPALDVPPDLAQIITVTAAGTILGIIPRALAGMSWDAVVSCRRVLSVACAAAVFAAITPDGLLWNGSWKHALPLTATMLVAVLSAVLIDAMVGAGQATERYAKPFPSALRDELGVAARIGMAMGISGILLAAGTSLIGLWAPPLVVVPLLLTQFAFRRYASAQRTYRTTVRSMSRTTEVAGFTAPGQNLRTAQLAVAMGDDLGLSQKRLEALEYAALLAGVGQLALADPSPGGASLLRTRDERRNAAEIGAEVIERSGVLDQVAEIVRHSSDAYRAGRANNPDIPLESGIINVATAYEQLVGQTGNGRAAALESIGLSIGDEFDPAVVESLRRVIKRGFRF
jgi:HD domain